MIKISILLSMLLAVSHGWAADGDLTKIPPSAQAILDQAEKAIGRNRVAYDDANGKSLADAEKGLKAELEKMTKAGKLEEALAIKKTLESFRDDLVKRVDEKAQQKLDLLGEPIAPSAIVGTWKLVYNNPRKTERVIQISNTLSVTVTGGAGSGTSYALEYDSQHKLFIGFFSPDKGKPETYRVVNGKLEVKHWADGGDWKIIAPTFSAVGTKD